mgnify:FL=1
MEKLKDFLSEFHNDMPLGFWFWLIILGMFGFLMFIGICWR